MTPALALEAVMLHPDFPRIAAALRAAAPAGLVDQADAAATDAHQVVTTVGAVMGSDGNRYAAPDQVPGWLRLGLLDVAAAWLDGRASTCRHSPTPCRPVPVLAASWRPDLVTCVGCAHLFGLGGDRDRTCDRCGRICAGVDHSDGIYPGMVQLGPLVYQYGTCHDCRPAITATDNPLSATQTAEPDRARGTGRVRPRGRRGRQRGRGTR